MSEKKAKFIAINGPFAVRVAPDSGELDEDGKPKKDGKLFFNTHEPTEVSEIKRKVTVNVRQPDGSYQEQEIERTIDPVARLRQYEGKWLSEMKDGKPMTAPKAASKADTKGK